MSNQKVPLSQKQVDSFIDSNRRLNIWEGSVRSGKSFISVLKFAKAIREAPAGQAMIVGVSRDALQRNVLFELCSLLGFPIPTPKASQMEIYGRIVHLVGANDERAQRRIQGSTLSLAYVDEITLIPQGFFKMLLSRLSVPGAQLFGTTNPDSPFHWLKAEFLDNKNLDMAVFKFRIDDNPSLDQEYINNIKREYQGLWYKRYIDGEWVLAEGTVYDFFDEEIHVIDVPPGPAEYYVVGVDYGTVNPTAFVLVGYNKRYWPNVWVEKEYFYDSRKMNRQKTDSDYSDDMKAFIAGYNVRSIYIDPSAASFKLEMMKAGITGIADANNDVINGIRTVSSLFSNGTLKIVVGCRNVIREMQTYRWNETAGRRGKDEPLKEFDHSCFVAGTKVLTACGQVPIEQVKVGDLVRTRSGWNRVEITHKKKAECITVDLLGKKITCTPEHEFFTCSGWKQARDLIPSDMLIVDIGDDACGKKSNSTAESIADILNLKTTLIDSTTRITDVTSTGIFTNSTMEQFHPDTIFITKTATPSTTTLAISSVSQLLSISPCMLGVGAKIGLVLSEITVKGLDHSQRNGMQVLKGENGTGVMPINPFCSDSQREENATSAGQNISQLVTDRIDFVQITVSLSSGETLALMMRKETALAAINLPLIDIANRSIAVKSVSSSLEEVYNLAVENEHEYFVENILVSNCDALRYVCYTHFKHLMGQDEPDMRQVYDQVRGIQSELPHWFRTDTPASQATPSMPPVFSSYR